jgi:hypothetical protein
MRHVRGFPRQQGNPHDLNVKVIDALTHNKWHVSIELYSIRSSRVKGTRIHMTQIMQIKHAKHKHSNQAHRNFRQNGVAVKAHAKKLKAKQKDNILCETICIITTSHDKQHACNETREERFVSNID